MQFTKTTVALLLPLLAIASPTPSNENTAFESRGSVSVDVGALRDLQQRIYDASGQITVLVQDIVSTSNAVVGGTSGEAAESYLRTLNDYQSDQAKALADLGDLARSLGNYASSFQDAEKENSDRWS